MSEVIDLNIYNISLMNGAKKRCEQCFNVSEESNFHGPYPINSLYHFMFQWLHKICINSGINNAKDIRLYFPKSAGSANSNGERMIQ